MIFKPRRAQELAIPFAIAKPRCALWMDMGLGKTVSTLTAWQALRAVDEVQHALVLAPLRVARDVWPYEPRKWDHLRHVKVVPILGTAAQRRAAIREPADMHVINYDNLPWLLEEMKAAGIWPWDMVIADESPKIKNYDAIRFRGVPKRKDPETGAIRPARPGLKHILPYTKRWINLTGTPAPNGLQDLWSQTYLLDQGERLGHNITAFRNRWFVLGMDRQWHPGAHAEAEIKAKLRDVCLTLEAKDYMDLPPLVANDLWVDLPPDALAAYKTLEREFFVELGEGKVTAQNAAVKAGKMLQAANGFLYLDREEFAPRRGPKEWTVIHEEKLDTLADVLEEVNGMPLLVTYEFKADLAQLKARFPFARTLGTKRDEDDWNSGLIPMLLVHPASAGHGLNLQYGSNHICMFSMTWNLEYYQQVIERLGPVRQAQAGLNRPVFLHRILARGTMDEVAVQRNLTKASLQDSLKAAMKTRY